MATKHLLEIIGLDKTGRAFQNVQKNVRTTDSALKTLSRSLIGVFSAAAVGTFAKRTLEATDRVGKLATRLGASTEALSELQFVAERSGVSIQTMNMALQRMQRRLGEASATGKGEAVPALERLGLEAERLARLPLDQQFTIIAEALSGVESNAERTALAMKFFDSEGVALLQTMEGGASSINALREEARTLGVTLTQDMADSAAKANDSMTNLQARLNGLGREVVLNLAPSFSDFLGYLGRAIEPVTRAGAMSFDALFSVASRGLQALATAVQTVLRGVRAAMEFFGRDTKAISQVIAGLGGVAEGAGKRAEDAWSGATAAFEEFRAATHNALTPQRGEAGDVAVPSAGGGGPTLTPKLANNADELLAQIDKDMASLNERTEDPLARLRENIAGALVDGVSEGTSGMLDSFASTLQRMASQLLESQVLNLLKSLPMFGGGGAAAGGGLASVFAGFFADGGRIPGGQFGVVGEQGPEFVSGPAMVTPPSRMGGMTLTNNITIQGGATQRDAMMVERAVKQGQAQLLDELSRRGRI